MKRSSRSILYVTLLYTAGGAALRYWLQTTENSVGLLAEGHPAQYLMLTIFALYLQFIIWRTKGMNPPLTYGQHFEGGLFSQLPGTAGMLSVIAFSIQDYLYFPSRIRIFALIADGAAALAMAVIMVQHMQKKKPPFGSLCVIPVAIMINIISHCPSWLAEPQWVRYVAPLTAAVLSLFSSYYHAAFRMEQKNYRAFLVTSHLTIFFCGLSVCSGSDLLYLGLGLWNMGNLLCNREVTP